MTEETTPIPNPAIHKKTFRPSMDKTVEQWKEFYADRVFANVTDALYTRGKDLTVVTIEDRQRITDELVAKGYAQHDDVAMTYAGPAVNKDADIGIVQIRSMVPHD